jgi:hypothetical protein
LTINGPLGIGAWCEDKTCFVLIVVEGLKLVVRAVEAKSVLYTPRHGYFTSKSGPIRLK